MADWRFLTGWSDAELERRLEARRGLTLNFDPDAAERQDPGWRRYATETTVGMEGPGPPEPGGPFERAWEAVVRYEFSEPEIVTGHFDPDEALYGRVMLLELKAMGFRFLAGTRVGAIRDESSDHQTVRGYRYDTLAGHIEAGREWFLLTKSHATGEIRFRIAAQWRPGDFPNAWSRIGFKLIGRRYQRRWVRRAHERMRRIVTEDLPVPVRRARLLHEGERDRDRTEEGA